MSGLVNNDNYEIKPSKIRLEASSICQLKCPSCPNPDNAMHSVVGNGFLKSSEFQRLINENPWVKEIELSNYGEIFLNPELLEILKYAYERNVTLKADNGVNLNNVSEGVLEGLVKYGLQNMTVSIDGASNETYKIYRVKGNFDIVIERIKKINLFKQQYQSAYPQLTWQFVVFGHNEHEIQLAQKLASELGMSFHLKLNWDNEFSPVRDLEYIRKLVGAASREEYKQKYGVDYGQGFCNQLWDEPQLNWDGKVLGCCRNFWGDFGGNAFSDGLLKSINGEKIKYAREMLLGNKTARDDIPCTTCSIYLHIKSQGKWLRRTLLSVSDCPSVQKESNKTKHEETVAFYKSLDISIGGLPKEKIPKQACIDMSDSELMAFYSERYADSDIAAFLPNEYKGILYGLCNLVKPGEFYLDVGCASGAHMEILYQRGIQGIGLDLAVPNVLKGRDIYPHLKFIHGFAETIPFKDDQFDIVLLGDVIEHFRKPKVTLAECLRVAKIGIALCVPIKPEITEEHINPFSFGKIINLLKFYKLKIHFYDSASGEISQSEAELNIQAFPWLIVRAEKTAQTNGVIKKMTTTEGQAEHSRVVGEILSSDQWCSDTDHQRDETHVSRFKLLSHLVEGQKVLEIGSGNGDLSVEIAKLGFDVVGIDVSAAGIHQSVELAKKEYLDGKTDFIVMDATNLDFPDDSFDTVLIPEVLEHIRDSRRLLEQSVRVVRNGGRIIVSVPDGLSVPYPGHLRVFFKDTLTTELSQYAEEIQWHDLPFKKWLICSFFVRKKGLDITQGPPVDILIPTYNGREYIRRAIKSVLDQTYQSWNIIVINDGGEDVRDIIDGFYDSRIKYLVAEHKGKSHALNIGIKNSNGKYIGYLDDDDILYPLHLEFLVKAVLDEKKDFVYSDWYEVSLDENNKEFERIFEFRQDIEPWMLIRQNYINHKCILHKRSLLDRTGLYDEQLDILIDWDMIRRLAFLCPPYHIWGATSERLRYYHKAVLENRITGLWHRDSDKARRSVEAITNKTMRLAATARDLKKALVDAMLHPTIAENKAHVIELENAIWQRDLKIEQTIAENKAHVIELENAIWQRDLNIEQTIAEKKAHIIELENAVWQRDLKIEQTIAEKKAHIIELENAVWKRDLKIEEIYSSISWRIGAPLRFIYRVIKAPFGGNNRPQRRISPIWQLLKEPLLHPKIIILRIRQVRIILRQGGINKLRSTIRNHNSQKMDSGQTAPGASQSMIAVADKDPDWQDYELLLIKFKDYHSNRLSSLNLKAAALIKVKEGDLLSYAARLNFPKVGSPEVSIVIPAYNNERITLECLASIQQNTASIAYEVIIVDDGSTDKFGQVLSKVKNIVYVKNERNIGFIASCNKGAQIARGIYIVFLNNDVQVIADWLKPLVDTIKHDSTVGAVGPKVIYPDGRLQEAGVSMRQDISADMIGLFADPALARYNYIREVEYCSGVCLLVNREIFLELGGFDTDYGPAYCEDADLCFKLRNKGLRILYNSKSEIVHYLSATADTLDNEFKQRCITCNTQKFAERWQKEVDELKKIRLIAFYLPQYHPIPENDLWWGKGFTDWKNVVKAKPNYAGHYQPHIPSDLGYYDLQDEEVMASQAELAKRYGIYGFCYYYYWFAGKRLLEMPLERMLKTGKPDMPFCLCWANENWTRTWDGKADDVLIGQKHSDEDDRAVIKDLIRYMRHTNYIRINGKPLLLVYRIGLFPDIVRTQEIWRTTCREEGIGEIYLAFVGSFELAGEYVQPSKYGFDASVEFPPHEMASPMSLPGKKLNLEYNGVVSDYRELLLRYTQEEVPGFTRFRTVMAGWDSTPRHPDNAYIFANSTPGAYQAWLEFILRQTYEQNFGDERIVFINAWNEWAEGAHLEPDERFGHGFLEATRNALECTLLKKD